MFFITSLTSLSLLPELADVAEDALVVSDEEDAVEPVKVSSRDWTEVSAVLTVVIADSNEVTFDDNDVFSVSVHETELLTLEISTDRVYTEVSLGDEEAVEIKVVDFEMISEQDVAVALDLLFPLELDDERLDILVFAALMALLLADS